MKKKIKDITIEEIVKVCKKQYDCYSCPLEQICAIFPMQYKKKDLEKEIKI